MKIGSQLLINKSLRSIGLALLFLPAACNYRVEKTSNVGQDDPKLLGFVPSYNDINKSVFQTKCLQCHSNSGGNQGHLNLETYDNVKAYRAQIETRSLINNNMPPQQPLRSIERLMLRTWLQAGMPKEREKLKDSASDPQNNDVNGAPKNYPEINQIVFENWEHVQDRLFAKYCFICHQSPAPEAGLDLSSAVSVRANANKIFDRLVIRQDMPLRPIGAPTVEEKRAFADWVVRGMP